MIQLKPLNYTKRNRSDIHGVSIESKNENDLYITFHGDESPIDQNMKHFLLSYDLIIKKIDFKPELFKIIRIKTQRTKLPKLTRD